MSWPFLFDVSSALYRRRFNIRATDCGFMPSPLLFLPAAVVSFSFSSSTTGLLLAAAFG